MNQATIFYSILKTIIFPVKLQFLLAAWLNQKIQVLLIARVVRPNISREIKQALKT